MFVEIMSFFILHKCSISPGYLCHTVHPAFYLTFYAALSKTILSDAYKINCPHHNKNSQRYSLNYIKKDELC